MDNIVKIMLVSFFLFFASEVRSQNLHDSSLNKRCDGIPPASYAYWVKGRDTLRYFICSKILLFYALDKTACYSADVIYPSFVKKKNDFNSRELAIYLMNKYNLYEIRMFKTCRVRNLAWMAGRPADQAESNKIDREIQKNTKTYRRSVEVL